MRKGEFDVVMHPRMVKAAGHASWAGRQCMSRSGVRAVPGRE